jgi:NADPH2:quinone reductase
MNRAILVRKPGGPSALKWERVDTPDPKTGEILLKTTAVGLNFIDTYHRKGLYPLPTPFIPGVESVGLISKLGRGVTGFKIGDRVACVSEPMGAYAEYRVFPAARLVRIPRDITDHTAASMMLKGLTAAMLAKRVYRVKSGDMVLIHAAAGGVGLILSQWAKSLGATVIGTVGSAAKARLAKDYGVDHVINYNKQNFVNVVARLTKNKKLPVVFDSVGAATFPGSLDCLMPMGLWVTYGNASGPVAPLAPLTLMQKGSLFMTRPMLNHYISDPIEYKKLAGELFSIVRNGGVKVEINQSYDLKDAQKAHTDLEARKTTGSTLLIP